MKRRLPSTMTANGAPPEDAAVLYAGKVMHHRLHPVGHRFSYKVYSLLIDVDRLDEANRLSFLLGIEAPGLLSFRATDHLRKDQTDLRHQADAWFREAKPSSPLPHRWLLLCYPRMFGWVFNPISVWFGLSEDDTVQMIVYDVRNTFGGRHAYLAPVIESEISNAGIRQSSDKRLHVSPFIGPEMTYDFRVLPPGEAVKLRIHETDREGPLFEAVFAGRQHPVTTRSLLGYLFAIPFLPFKIYAAIHWEALKLWIKGVKFRGAGDQDRDDHDTIQSRSASCGARPEGHEFP
ncbi:DUF1365 domain-containing protein [Notoacmeibacter ruber]|uniref:DUF1365 domain-containing protein n=1 Tax=Notoacmeibacter ruber TaxID=2670375 RepID=A0A3L7JCG0_9HYPH|nr:DUF1365 domain-containing protein [Notoacmeibacter ruber]RLQ88029.1 DUF1365 domain-containing protein [Notoacmeibacter ruber]